MKYLLIALILIASCDVALAQAVVVAEPAALPAWMQTIQDVAYTIVAVLIPLIGAWLASYIKTFLGQSIAASLQAAFQAAALRAAAKALNQAGAVEQAKPIGQSPSPATIAIGTDYLKTTMAETIVKLGVSDKNLSDVVEANIAKLKVGASDPVAAIALNMTKR